MTICLTVKLSDRSISRKLGWRWWSSLPLLNSCSTFLSVIWHLTRIGRTSIGVIVVFHRIWRSCYCRYDRSSEILEQYLVSHHQLQCRREESETRWQSHSRAHSACCRTKKKSHFRLLRFGDDPHRIENKMGSSNHDSELPRDPDASSQHYGGQRRNWIRI